MAVSGIVLAGGRSRRMGRDKRTIAVDGRPLLVAALDLVSAVADDLIVACRREDEPPRTLLEGRRVRLAFDAVAAGPVAGIEAALRIARNPLAVVVPTDMPRLTGGALIALVHAAIAVETSDGAVYASVSGPLQFPLVIRVSALPVVERQLASGDFRVRSLLAALQLARIDASGPLALDPRAFVNLNTPEDIEPPRNIDQRSLPADLPGDGRGDQAG